MVNVSNNAKISDIRDRDLQLENKKQFFVKDVLISQTADNIKIEMKQKN